MESARILVVEDSATQRAIYKDMLEKEGYTVFLAQDGADGLSKVKTVSPDVIITDLNMPKLSGFELVKALKHDEKTKCIPIICVSATYMDIVSKMKMLMQYGAEEYFYATQNQAELIAKVKVMARIRKIYMDLLEKNR
jgi:DNA-binding response OmpR family regulator